MDIEENENGYKSGFIESNGDGTVPLVSLGYMCVDGWKNKKFNPHGVKIQTKEYLHNPSSILNDLRGGEETGDHVDIMGNTLLLNDILTIVSGNSEEVKDEIHSNIKEISSKISKKLKE
jgi:phospholipid:diacylglycerol acyltransferase